MLSYLRKITPALFREKLQNLKSGNNEDLYNYDLSYNQIVQANKHRHVMSRDIQPPCIKLGYLAPGNSDFLQPALELIGIRHHLDLGVTISDYNQIDTFCSIRDIGMPLSEIDCLYFGFDSKTCRFLLQDDSKQQTDKLISDLLYMQNEANIPFIYQTVLPAISRSANNFDLVCMQTLSNNIHYFNSQLIALCSEHKNKHILNDVNYQAATIGYDKWFDASFWHHAKLPMGLDCIPYYADGITNILRSIFSLQYKCLVLDLDNTLWGGVIGDDGLDGIKLGEGCPIGEIFIELQQYILTIKNMGVILCVCSKNDKENAILPFIKHPDMVLKESDITIFTANWDNKADNIQAIANQLNIGLDSIVFLDDNIFERNLVRQYLPQVQVPELPEQAELYARTLSQAGYFEKRSLSDEDRNKTALYQANLDRDSLSEQTNNISDYLNALDMTLEVDVINAINIDRVSQLVMKSNQFNLTTVRYTKSQLLEMSENENFHIMVYRLKDKFGDNGIISVVILEQVNLSYVTRLWLMSCRVLKRNVEQAVLNSIVENAQERNIKAIKGLYLPTKKNAMVKEHYKHLGFSLIDETQGSTTWQLDIKDFNSLPVMINTVKVDKEVLNACSTV